MDEFIIDLGDPAASLAPIGGKARTLSRLRLAGLRVPPGWVLPSGLSRDHRERLGIEKALADLFRRPALLEPDFLSAALADLRRRILEAPVPRHHVQALRDRILRAHPDVTTLIVRSSGRFEDGRSGSAAGQFLSIPRVRPEDLEDAVRQLWACVLEPAPVRYNLARHLPAIADMAVLVQPQREFERAGVVFTRDPMDPDSGHVRLEWVEGTAEGLMDGSRDPTTHRLHRRGGLAGDERGLLGRIRDAALHCERILGEPQDVEFGVRDGEVEIVQSRPIAAPEAIHRPPRLLANFNVSENLPRPVTPLGQSVFTEGFVVQGLATRPPFWTLPLETLKETFFVFHRSRIYWNITGLSAATGPGRHQLLRSLFLFADAGQERFIRKALRRGDLDHPRVLSAMAHIGAGLRDARRRLPDLFRDRDPRRTMRRINAEGHAHLDRVFAANPPGSVSLHEDLPADLIRISRALIENLVLWGVSTGIVLAVLALLIRILTGKHPRLLLQIPGHETQTMAMNRALCDLARSLGQDPGLREVIERGTNTAFLEAVRAHPVHGQDFSHFLETFGHRGWAELDLGRPRWNEDPGSLRPVIKRLMDHPGIAPARDHVPAPPLRPLLRLVPLTSAVWDRVFNVILHLVRLGAPAREDPKHHVLQFVRRIRAHLHAGVEPLSAQGIIRNADDLPLLRLVEIVWAQRHGRPGALFDLIDRRHRQMEERESEDLPAVMWVPAPPPGWDDDATDSPGIAPSGPTLEGSPASAGRVRGRPRVIQRAGDDTELEPGDILVAPFTDPSWTPLFLTVEAVVVETGGVLSHAAVLARELGIPCVMGVPDACARLADHATIEVDGTTGQVRIIDEPPADSETTGPGTVPHGREETGTIRSAVDSPSPPEPEETR